MIVKGAVQWLLFAVLVLCGSAHAQTAQQSCTLTYAAISDLTGSISVSNAFIEGDLCYFVEPRNGLPAGTQPKMITITVGPYNISSDEIIIYNNYFPNKAKALWASTNANSNESVTLDPRGPIFYIYYRRASNGRKSFSISWVSGTETERVLSLALFVGVAVSVLLVIIVACVVKVTLRRRLLRRALKSKRLQQRINTTPPRLEQAIVWTTVGVSVLLFVLFTSRAIRF